ncbi:MAG: chemotaxis protein CheA, partial [Clostridiales bacterium]|nr:chemotaxis protein CheA [Clostridiales bacterium]
EVHMVLTDDGRGLDYKRIQKIAKAKGMLKNVPADKVNRQFLSNIVFSPGFSTSETEDLHAGRGIGLNLVKDRLKEAGGKIRIQSKDGQGMVFDMVIPL